MPKLTGDSVPKYRHQNARNLAVVRIGDRDVYLGPWKSKASYLEYDRVITESLANGRRAPTPPDEQHRVTVVEVIAAYLKHCRGYYRKARKPTNEVRMVKAVASIAKRLYGRSAASDFGPLKLKAVRQVMIDNKQCRTQINKQPQRLVRMFKWAAAEEMIPGTIPQALRNVAGLRRGRTKAVESGPVLPVEDAVIQATLPHLPPVVADIVRLQRLAGMRPSEVCIIRPCDVDRSGEVWLYHPSQHKTEHHGRVRVVYLGPKAQAILRPYLLRAADAHCLCPKDSVTHMYRERASRRTTPQSCGNRTGTNRMTKPRRKAGDHYTKDSYNRAIARAVVKANEQRATQRLDPIGHWSANRLRHTTATDIRKHYGLEAAQILLGHAKADVTQVYAERDLGKAVEVARAIG